MLTRPGERRFRLRNHLLPALAVLVVVGGLVVVAALLFLLVFLVDDEADLGLPDALIGAAALLGAIVGATLAVAAVGVALDRVTLRAPLPVRVVAPVIVPLVGAALLAGGIDLGLLVIELSALLAGYWALFLGQGAVLRIVRLARTRFRGRRRPAR